MIPGPGTALLAFVRYWEGIGQKLDAYAHGHPAALTGPEVAGLAVIVAVAAAGLAGAFA